MLDSIKTLFNQLFSINKLTHYKKLDAEIKKLTSEQKKLKKEMKNFFIEHDLTEETVGQYRIILTCYDQQRIDTDKLKADYPAIYNQYLKTVPVKKFEVK